MRCGMQFSLLVVGAAGMNFSGHMIKVFDDKAQLAREAAALIINLADQAVQERGRFSIALSGGSTPQALFRLLVSQPYRAQLPWQKMHFFWGDERLVPPGDAGSNYFHAANILLNHVPVPAENIHRVLGELPAETTVLDYAHQLHKFAGKQRLWPRFDLVLLGLGSDGHTASLFPGSPAVDDPQVAVKAVTANYEDRPSQRLTLTPNVFNDARHLLFLVTGANKAEAVAAVLEGPVDWQQWPAQRIQPLDGTVTWFVDEPASGNISENR